MPAFALLANYVHDLSSTLWESDRFPLLALRWYGLSYLAGFALAYFVMRWLASRGRTTTPSFKIADLIFVTALFGVFLGGRLGYMLFYDLDSFLENPKNFFNFLGGGMASHGGILGVMGATFWFAWRNKLPWAGVGDDLVVGAPLGLLTGRMANFINGELWGKSTTSSLGVKFPTELPAVNLDEYRRLVGSYQPKGEVDAAKIVDIMRQDGSYERLVAELPTRHPSQLYEAATEGLLLFLILFFVRLRWPTIGHGMLVGLFFIGYACFRIFCELFREPDIGKSFIMGLQRGQFYSLFMILIGIGFVLWATVGPGRRRRLGSHEAVIPSSGS